MEATQVGILDDRAQVLFRQWHLCFTTMPCRPIPLLAYGEFLGSADRQLRHPVRATRYGVMHTRPRAAPKERSTLRMSTHCARALPMGQRPHELRWEGYDSTCPCWEL